MPELVTILEDASHKLTLATASGTKAPPSTPTDGADMAPWKQNAGSGSLGPRRCAIRFTAAAALNLTAISIWVFYDSAWSKLLIPANITFAAGDLSFTQVVDFPIGSRLAAAFTVSASSVTVEAYLMEGHVCSLYC